MTYTFKPWAPGVFGKIGDYLLELQKRFDPTAGHTHAGTAGEGPTLANAALAGVTWTDWTPTVTQSVSVTVTVDYAWYCTIGKLAIVQMHLTPTAAGTSGNAVIIGSIPAAIAPKYTGGWRICGSGSYRRTGVIQYIVTVEATTSTTLKLHGDGATDYLGVNPAFAIASSDEIGLVLAYEIA